MDAYAARMRPRTATIGCLAAGLAITGAVLTPPASAQDQTVTIMSRNIYLGADVGVALGLIPDMPAAAQFMWDQMRATDFASRAPLLAQEAATHRPAVIGIQEATTWECTAGLTGRRVVVYDFLDQLLDAMRATGVEYVIATDGTHPALNPGYSIPPIPGVTMVRDPQAFPALFGGDEAACGFTIGDALLVRADLADRVLASGTVEFAERTTIVPVLMEISRGYAWADIDLGGTPTRVVTTHLESLWDPGVIPSARVQADQLIADLASTTMPLIVLGDFNSDPRDPRTAGENPGGQPEVSAACPAGGSQCSAMRAMQDAGFANAGPALDDPANFTWGADALLAGPDLDRLPEALALGNRFGMTERLDYIWLRNGVQPQSAELIGAAWPQTPTWACRTPEQLANLRTAAAELGTEPAGCLPSDHAGVVATVTLPPSAAADAPLVDRGASGFPALALLGIAIIIGVLVAAVPTFALAGVVALVSHRPRRRATVDQEGSAGR